MSAPVRVVETEAYSRWLEQLKDRQVRTAVLGRVERLILGNPGDVAPVGQGVSELRIHLGAGWRVYYIKRGDIFVILLGGGSKATQKRDIEAALRLARSLEDHHG